MTNHFNELGGMLVPGPNQGVRYGQGKIVHWNPNTFENVIKWDGLTLRNLPVLAGTSGLTFQAGDTVGLLGWDAGGRGGSAVWWILGRLVLPGEGRGEEQVSFMASSLAETIVENIIESFLVSDLGKAVARDVIAETVHSDTVDAEETLSEPAGTSTSYDDLDTTGPSVTFTTETGRWIVLLVAHAGVSESTAGRMSYEATGAQSVSASDSRSSLVTDPGTAMGLQSSVVYANTHTGDPGEVTVTAKYLVIPPPADPPPNGVASWQNRTLVVIAY